MTVNYTCARCGAQTPGPVAVSPRVLAGAPPCYMHPTCATLEAVAMRAEAARRQVRLRESAELLFCELQVTAAWLEERAATLERLIARSGGPFGADDPASEELGRVRGRIASIRRTLREAEGPA